MLKNLIKYFWTINNDYKTVVNHKLLPVNNIDVIINYSSPIKYTINNKVVIAKNAHFSGIRNKHLIINQVGSLDVIGISFFYFEKEIGCV